LFSETVIAIDGSRFKAVNTRDKNYTHGAIERRMEQVEASIARYLSALDTADRQEGEVAEAKSIRLKDKLARLKQQMQHLREMEIAVQAAPDRQISLTDPDARAMATSGKGTGIVGYNVQTAVDVEHHLIVAHEVTNMGHVRRFPLFGQLPGSNKLKAGSRLLVSPFPEIKFMLSCCGVL